MYRDLRCVFELKTGPAEVISAPLPAVVGIKISLGLPLGGVLFGEGKSLETGKRFSKWGVKNVLAVYGSTVYSNGLVAFKIIVNTHINIGVQGVQTR